MNDLKYWVAFHQISGIGPKTFAKFEARFGDLETAWCAPVTDLVAAGLNRKLAGDTDRFRDEHEPDEILGEVERLGITPFHLRHPEYPPGVSALPQHFPRRNRVISGLCHGVLVVEAAFKSGAMLTVNWALEQDRDVFAVPGSALSEKSKGTNWLIQQGAKLTTCADDILEDLNIESRHTRSSGNPEIEQSSAQNSAGFGENALDNLARENNVLSIERRVVDLLENAQGSVHVDDITRELGESASAVSSVLVMLELKGIARQVGSMQFIADRERPVITS